MFKIIKPKTQPGRSKSKRLGFPSERRAHALRGELDVTEHLDERTRRTNGRSSAGLACGPTRHDDDLACRPGGPTWRADLAGRPVMMTTWRADLAC
eukprot:871125-Prorocentrum_minimum.AAC.1